MLKNTHAYLLLIFATLLLASCGGSDAPTEESEFAPYDNRAEVAQYYADHPTFSASRLGPIYRLIFNGKMAANSPRLAALAPKKAAWRPSGYRTSHVPSESWARTPTAALDLGCSITPPWHSAIATQISWTTSRIGNEMGSRSRSENDLRRT